MDLQYYDSGYYLGYIHGYNHAQLERKHKIAPALKIYVNYVLNLDYIPVKVIRPSHER